jgi:hypothetical protein
VRCFYTFKRISAHHVKFTSILQAQMDVNTVLGLAGAIAARASYDARRTLTAAANTARPNMLLTSKSSATAAANSTYNEGNITVTAAEAGATLIDLQLGMTLLQLGINPFEDGSSAPQLLRSFKNFDNEVSHPLCLLLYLSLAHSQYARCSQPV